MSSQALQIVVDHRARKEIVRARVGAVVFQQLRQRAGVDQDVRVAAEDVLTLGLLEDTIPGSRGARDAVVGNVATGCDVGVHPAQELLDAL